MEGSSDEPISKDIAAPIEPLVEGANLPQTKSPTEKRALTPSKGIGGTPVTSGKAAAGGQLNPQSQLGAAGLEKGIEGISVALEAVKPSEYNGDVRDLPGVPSIPKIEFEVEKEMSPEKVAAGAAAQVNNSPNNIPLAPMPSPTQNFAGLSFNSAVTGGSAGAGWPPDVNGDVGLNHYILAVNDAYAIYNKTGTQLAAFTENSLWSGQGLGTPCNINNFGDPVVVYDQLADRWILTHFAFATTGPPSFNPLGPYYECFAISKTSDPVAGGWWFYAVRMDTGAVPANTAADYPKFGNWNDGCLYMGANMFGSNFAAFSGTLFASFNKSDMESGAALRSSVVFVNNTTDPFTPIPSNISGAKGPGNLPPAGTPNYFVSESQTAFAFEVRKFTPGANCGAGGTLGAPTNITQAAYGLSLGNVVPQPPPATPTHNLDTLDDRLMQKVQYRNVAGGESLWVTQTTRTNPNTARPQWAQLNVTGGVVSTTMVQTQIYTPDTTLYRWMASIAADHVGNVALGYSTSNTSSPNFPSIAYSGRLVGDPLNNLPQTEVQLIAGTGPQTTTSTGTAIHRWGDYTSMSVDPADDCTFWYAGMYFTNVGADATRNWNTRIGSFKFPSCVSPTEAKLKTFTADAFDDGRVLLRWSSGYEIDNLGYNVYREVNGERTRINSQIIAGSALVTGANVALTAGKSYAWADVGQAGTSTRYWLEDIDLAGKSSWNGPITLSQKIGKAPIIDQSVLLGKIGLAQSQMTLGQGSVPVERKAGIAGLTPGAIQLQTDLAGQAAVKLAVKQEGWYRISQSDLVNAGFSAKVDPRNLQLYVDGRAVPMIVNGEQDGRFDPSDSVEFFGVGINSPVTDSHVYWLAAGTQAGTRITSSRGTAQTPAANSFQFAVERKDRTVYFSALRNGEAENFFGPVIGSTAVDQSLSLTNVSASPGGSALLEVAVQGVTTAAHQVRVTLNGGALGTISFSGQARGAQSFAVPQSSLREGVNSLQLVSLGGNADISLADSARVTYWHTYRADSNQLRLTAQGGQKVMLSGFTSNARVMDVTDANNPQELLASAGGGKSGPGTLTLSVPGIGQRTLYAFGSDQARTAALKINTPSNWRQAGRGADFVIFTRQDLMASLVPLAALRQRDGLSVAIVDLEDAYDEFSFGNKTPRAIKDFLQFAKNNWPVAPRFVLLAGDSSYDSKNYLGYGDSDLVPTKLIDTHYMETASDDWFADFNGSGQAEMAMGRLPVRNAAEMTALVSKITSYENSRVANTILLASDSVDGFDFAAANNLVRPFIPPGTQVSEVLRGSADDATVKAQLLAAINSGAKIVGYNGHGSANQWRGGILNNEDARSLTNGQSLSLFVVMTCLNGYFDDPVMESLAESLLKASNGGAVAVWASTGQADPSSQSAMNQAFYRELFGSTSLTVGEAAARAKSATTDSDVRRTWILFGDPSMHLK
ncbi:MAG TPA: C25 family cysteine peptidase [Blastocatellia bacterium]|nr:C25 family cysteine peptidase [Blastocatellia bacterium]